MFFKYIVLVVPVSFIGLFWYSFSINQNINSLFFALFATIFIPVLYLVKYYRSRYSIKKVEVLNRWDKAIIIYTIFAFLSTMFFFATLETYGGSAASDNYASWRYEHYEVGHYYLSDHGNFTLVSYQTWIRIKVFEQIVMPVFMLATIWNFLYFARKKGIRFLYTGKEDDVGFRFTNSTTLEKMGFIFLLLLISFISIFGILSLF